MPFDEREQEILSILHSKKFINIQELAKQMYVSSQTLRRDLMKLEEKGEIVRTHGGAKLKVRSPEERLSFTLRENENNTAKMEIARKAATLVHDEDVIFLDATTSAYCLIPYLVDFKDILVITNSARCSYTLGEMGIHNICTGGKMVLQSFSYIGSDALRTIQNYNANILFFSCKGVSLDGQLSSGSIEENDLRLAMMRQSVKKIFLCDSTKVGKRYLHNLCTVKDIDQIICEKALPPELSNLMEQ